MTLPTAVPKPDKTARVERHERRQQRKKASDDVKSAAKRRDGLMCRWPHCECRRIPQPLDGAHLAAAGMGGDPKRRRTTRAGIVSLCRTMHRRCHNGFAKVEPLTDQGADGPLSFWLWSEEEGWYMVAQERAIRIIERD